MACSAQLPRPKGSAAARSRAGPRPLAARRRSACRTRPPPRSRSARGGAPRPAAQPGRGAQPGSRAGERARLGPVGVPPAHRSGCTSRAAAWAGNAFFHRTRHLLLPRPPPRDLTAAARGVTCPPRFAVSPAPAGARCSTLRPQPEASPALLLAPARTRRCSLQHVVSANGTVIDDLRVAAGACLVSNLSAPQQAAPTNYFAATGPEVAFVGGIRCAVGGGRRIEQALRGAAACAVVG